MNMTAQQLAELKAAISDPDQSLLGPKMPNWYEQLSDDEKADVMAELSGLSQAQLLEMRNMFKN
jgi:cytochrome c1